MTYALSLYRSHKKRQFAEPVIESSFDLVSDKALEQLRKRGANIITTDKWNSISNESHDKAFTVANVMSADIVQEVYDYVERAVNEGWSFDTFKKKVEAGDLVDRMKKAGWTGENPSRLNVIFDTNISLAQGKGKYQRLMLNMDSKPYGVYHQLDRKSKNKDHEKWDGKKFRLDDPIWNTIMPPSAFGCACWVQATDDPTGVENGSDYIGDINPNDYPLSPVKTWKPDTDKYVDGIRSQLEAILKSSNQGSGKKQKTLFSDLSSASIERGDISDYRYGKQGIMDGSLTDDDRLLLVDFWERSLGFVPTPKSLIDTFVPVHLQENIDGKMVIENGYGKYPNIRLSFKSKDVTIIRSFYGDLSGVSHTYFEITNKKKRLGIHQNMANQFALYQAMGIKSVLVHANITTGCYLWGRYGFDFRNESECDDFYKKLSKAVPADISKLLDIAKKEKWSIAKLLKEYPNIDWAMYIIKKKIDWHGEFDFGNEAQVTNAIEYIGNKLNVKPK